MISIAKLPVTGETFVAREKGELARLDEAWEDGTNVISFVARAGPGSRRWSTGGSDRMQDGRLAGRRAGPRLVVLQPGHRRRRSVERGVHRVCPRLARLPRATSITSPWRKGEVLARLVREQRTLLILDGLEPLQHPPGAQKGRIKDPAIQTLVEELAADNPGLCVITTRLEVTDIAGRAGTESVDLEKLPPEAGAQLLRALGVRAPRRSSEQRPESEAATASPSPSSAPTSETSAEATSAAATRSRSWTRRSESKAASTPGT